MQSHMAFAWINVLVSAIAGGVAGYLSSRFTDRRRKKEATREESDKFAQVAAQMPDLLREMKKDLTDHPHVREFFVLLRGAQIGIFSSPTFQYKDNEHPDLMGKAHILENNGYLTNVIRDGFAPKYRMSEDFVRLLRGMSPPTGK